MYCQDGNPEVGLSEVYDGDQLFSFNFSQNIRVPRLPEFADWAHQIEDTPAIFFDKGFCREMIEKVGPLFEGKIPVSRGQGFWGGDEGVSGLHSSPELYTELLPFSSAPHLSGFLLPPPQDLDISATHGLPSIFVVGQKTRP